MYFSNNGSTFHPRGIAFPDVDKEAGIDEYVSLLDTIKDHSPNINMIRMYEVPPCAYVAGSTCLEVFMHHADSLGIYVLVPGSGKTYGYWPGPDTCGSHDANWCYKEGGVLGFGEQALQLFNFPNTLALVIGNELDQQQPGKLPAIKAYARDLRSYQKMCHDQPESPSYQQYRMIPLMYASSDAYGDAGFHPKAQYLFCGNHSVSIDIFGLNIERYCDQPDSAAIYKSINEWVSGQRFPGAYMHSEEGCARPGIATDVRSWEQIKDFFTNYPSISGFVAYAYYGTPTFNMFDSKLSTAAINVDGKNFFDELDQIGALPDAEQLGGSYPECTTTLDLGVGGVHELVSVYSVHWYSTGSTGWAQNCPKPLGAWLSATDTVV
jgi:hypothetical protein